MNTNLKRLFRKSARLGVPDLTLAGLSGASPTAIHFYRSGRMNCPPVKFAAMSEVLSGIEDLVQRASPIPVDRSDVRGLRKALQHFNQQ
jgi:hypothetical protein